jgi:hypothetical protein
LQLSNSEIAESWLIREFSVFDDAAASFEQFAVESEERGFFDGCPFWFGFEFFDMAAKFWGGEID